MERLHRRATKSLPLPGGEREESPVSRILASQVSLHRNTPDLAPPPNHLASDGWQGKKIWMIHLHQISIILHHVRGQLR